MLVNEPAGLSRLSDVGVRVAGIANNHAADLGPAGEENTAVALRASGIAPAGGAAGVARFPAGGRRVAVTAHDLAGGVPPTLASELEDARRGADLLVVTFHETEAPSYLPSAPLRDAVEIALRAGADVIAAHGRHAIGAVERRGDAVIAWGLGNLAFECECTDERDAIVLSVRATEGAPLEAAVIPIDAGLGGAAARPASDPGGIFDLLEAIGSRGLVREGDRARF